MTDSTPRSSPIGVFDSGIGGLTVVKEISRQLPMENLIYLGDTARVPYGTKSTRTVIRYSEQNTRFLLSQGIKLLVVACNTASSVAIPALREMYDIPVVGVIEPGARRAVSLTKTGKIGVIGTPSTIKSSTYTKEIHRIDPSIEVYSTPCPLFVPIADEGLEDTEISRLAARRYLSVFRNTGIDVLILGCTHYPLLKKVIQETVGDSVTLVDSAEEIAKDIEAVLKAKGIENGCSPCVYRRFYLTDASDTFTEVAGRFLGENIEGIEEVDLVGEHIK